MPGRGVVGSVVRMVTSSFTGRPSGSGVPSVIRLVSTTASAA
jgi:hypothetical protein